MKNNNRVVGGLTGRCKIPAGIKYGWKDGVEIKKFRPGGDGMNSCDLCFYLYSMPNGMSHVGYALASGVAAGFDVFLRCQ
jgi:hypothetical protein